MPRSPRPLDVPPATLLDAVNDLAKIANICLKAGLPNAGARCAVIADWLAKVKIQTVDLEALDAEWAVGTVVRPPPGEVHSRRSTVHPPAPKPPADAALNTDTAGLALVQAALKAGAQSTAALAKVLGMDRLMGKQKLKRWRKQGLLVSVGHGPATKWDLPSLAQMGRSADDIAAARDIAILAEVQKWKSHGVDEKALVKALPAEPGAATLPTTRLQGVIRRLTFKNQIEFRDGRFYPVA